MQSATVQALPTMATNRRRIGMKAWIAGLMIIGTGLARAILVRAQPTKITSRAAHKSNKFGSLADYGRFWIEVHCLYGVTPTGASIR
jgi:hypothetical protein